jgi:hypothetical protein
MAKTLDPQKELTDWQQIAYTNMIERDALLSLLQEKGIITKEEYLERVKLIHWQFQQRQGK